ncbi:hypothetical protein KVR01_002002 [Diaporthe batatas]|uniref:uncharacterized protein n=1 Tax=Diaporthe batatas TaxID=748121 RepID=UPI001D04A4FA|nr:uncharacterized protein KVR01_002002 [Diaporthe batatas]KAG8166313.1 hypothetical protein KVR01_002002 [Diaporthe batatas]
MGDQPNGGQRGPFPWELGIFDAHCHPTDTMDSIPAIPTSMRARVLTVMATRSQDQHLVAQVADEHGFTCTSRQAIASSSASSSASDGQHGSHIPNKIVPAFGWHPWFSHQLYDDTLARDQATYDPESSDLASEKLRHYNAVLTPPPRGKDDDGFIDQLPTPQPLSELLSQTRKYLEAHPLALVGEVGIDKAFRLPSPGVFVSNPEASMTQGRRNGERLSPYRVNMDHQIRIMKAQLNLAGQTGRPVSVHGVQAHGVLYNAIKSTWKGHERAVVTNRERKRIAKGVNEDFSSSSEDESDDEGSSANVKTRKQYKPRPYPPRICLHSYTGTVDVLKQYTNDRACPAKIFFSFSLCVNYSTGGHERDRKKHLADDVIRACPDDRILVESDLHTAGQQMDDMLEEMYRKVCEVKGWGLREGVERIRDNYLDFIFGPTT